MSISEARRHGGVRICLLGVTGLTGSAMLAQASGREDVEIVGVARRELVLAPGTAMQVLVGDTSVWPELIGSAHCDVLVCALGTTIKAAGSQGQFRAVDYDLVCTSARAARDAGIDHLVFVSSIGAARGSSSFYLDVKGRAEQALRELGFRRLDIVRPGLLRGHRRDRRLLEGVGRFLAPLADQLVLHGPLRRFRSIRVSKMAKALIALALEEAPGTYIHEHDALMRYADLVPWGAAVDR